ncbi:MAG: AmmeMemoRadiSam system protein A [Methylobacter sp.]
MSLTKENQLRLLNLARASIEHGVRTGSPLQPDLSAYPAPMLEQRATFVTLNRNRQLRGCIGRLVASRPLVQDIAENAFCAAFKDPRFPPLQGIELEDLVIHLSILTPAEPMSFDSEQDLLAQLQPGVDGLILEDGRFHGTFLPSVWEQLPNPKQFLRNLKQKAGLPADYWSENIRVYRYRTEVIE